MPHGLSAISAISAGHIKKLWLRRRYFCLVFHSLNRNFAIIDGELTPSRQKKQINLFCFALDFS